MGRDEHRRHKNNKAKLPQTPANQKDPVGEDIEMPKASGVKFEMSEDVEKGNKLH